MKYFAYLFVLIVAFYTGLYALEIRKEKNYSGFLAITFLVLVITVLPFYYLFLMG